MQVSMSEWSVHSRQRSCKFIVLIILGGWRMIKVRDALHCGNIERVLRRKAREIMQDWTYYNHLLVNGLWQIG